VIDSSQATVWGSTTGNDAGDPTNVFVPKFVVIALPAAVDVADFAVDPSAGCGDGGSASTGDFRIETSPNGTTWTQAASGTFTLDDRGRLNTVTPTAGTHGVRFVRFTILGNQTPDFATSCPGGAFSGCSFTDLTEIEVHGAGELTGQGRVARSDVARYLSTRERASATRSSTWSRRGSRSRRVVSARNIVVTVTSWSGRCTTSIASPACSTPSSTTRR
jgi:hypothetical protein